MRVINRDGRTYALLAFAAWLGIIAAAPAGAQSNSKAQAAYELAVKCLVANNHAEYLRRQGEDPEGAARYDAQAHRAFDLAISLGHQLGLSNEQMNADIGAISGRELPHMATDDVYFRQAVSTCRGAGLM